LKQARPVHNTLTPLRCATLALVAAFSGCSAIDGLFSGDKVDYKSTSNKTTALEVPPDLSQLARDNRYQPQGGVISAAARAGATGATPSASGLTPTVAVTTRGALRVERLGQQRWLVTDQTPEQLWPQLKAFWTSRGFTLEVDEAQMGLMETNWNENRAKLPSDVVANTVGRLLGRLYDTGERDRFRTRVERAAGGTGSEIFISHRGAEEVYTSDRRESTTWQARANDPQLEAEFLSRLMVVLGGQDAPAARSAVAAAPEGPPRARLLAGQPAAAIEVDDGFDRAWRRVGLALDRGGFTVEDRDRAGGIYFVRYVDPKSAGKEEAGFFSKLFGGDNKALTPVRYRINVKGGADKTVVSVLTSAGAPEAGDNGQRIVALLVKELR
jgi:outer membrane protein assembly factor BamC